MGTDGRTRHFIVQTGQHWHGSSGSAEERMMQLLRLVNGLLDKHPESRSRKLAAHAPIIVPVYSQVHCCAAETHACMLVWGSLCKGSSGWMTCMMALATQACSTVKLMSSM